MDKSIVGSLNHRENIMTLTLRFDGLYMGILKKKSTSSGAGFMCYGWIISRAGRIIARGHGGYLRGRDASSNIAEYLALIEGLEALQDMGVRHEAVHIIGDAKSIIDQMCGKASVNSDHIRPLYQRARRIACWFSHLEWAWTPRRDNRAADALTRRALKQIRSNPQSYAAAMEAIEPGISGSRLTKKFWPVLDLRIYQPAM
jgi:ribonuclease HI